LATLDPEKRHRIEECLKFLSLDNRNLIVKKIGEIALTRNQKGFPEELPSYDEEQKYQFYLELQRYLGLIRNAILADDYSSIQVPSVKQSLPHPKLYVDGLEIFKREIPEDIDAEARLEIEIKTDYLIKRIRQD
jgi:hypothetical protein